MRNRITAAAALLAALAVSATPSAGGGARPMDPYSNASAFILLVEQEDADIADATQIFEQTTPRMFAAFYRKDTNRVVILGDDDGRKEIPTFSTAFVDIFAAAVPVIDQEGNFNTTPLPSTGQPLIDLQGTPSAIRWPQGTGGIGQVPGVTGLVGETAPDTTTAVKRHVEKWMTVPYLMTEDTVVSLNLNSASVVQVVDGVSGYQIIPTMYVFRDASADVVTATGSFGFDSVASNNTGVNLTSIDGVDGTLVVLPDPGGARGGDGEPLKWKTTTLEGSGRTVQVDIFGYYRKIPE